MLGVAWKVNLTPFDGAMDTMYQRGKIQEESMTYEHKKHDGSLPLIGVNTFLPKDHGGVSSPRSS